MKCNIFENVRRVSCVLLFALFAMHIAGKPANAATLTVPAQYKTIQDAVNNANPGDTILVADGTYTGVKNREIDFGGIDLIVKSINGPANCIIDCQQAGRAFALQNGETAASNIEGFTIKNGMASGYGGGIYASDSSHPTILSCVFTGNTASGGGGIYGGAVTNCIFTGNTANEGGGMYYGTATNCTFTSNIASTYGGGMSRSNVSNCTFTGNLAYRGGAMSEGTATNCVINGNRASEGGGGMAGGGAGGTVTNCAFNSNTAGSYGGGMYDGTATNCAFVGNTVTGTSGYGGGTAYVTAENCVFYYNTATANGGGAAYGRATNCAVFGNTANANGGGVSDSSLLNCTVAGNTAKGSYGGGIYNTRDNTITSCVVWSNTASLNGFNVKNDTGGTLNITYSDIQRGYFGTGNINADPLFVSFSTGDLHLTAASPCINGGTADANAIPYQFTLPAKDLDGGSRIAGNAPDMGAYETGNPGVSGTLAFLGLVLTAPVQNVVFQFRPLPQGTPITKIVTVLPNGAFRLYGIPAGNYNLWIKPDRFLADLIPIDDSSGNVSGITADFLGGDADNNNVVNIGDFGLLVNAFGSMANVADSGCDIRADFNGDGLVDIGDFGLLVNSYGESGAQ